MIPRIFIFEGIDGCGKTTQCNYLKEYLQKNGTDCWILREPGGTFIGEYIRDWIKDDKEISPLKQLFLFCIARKEICNLILDTITNTKKTIILDRFVLSTYAYQGTNIDKDVIDYHLNYICPQYNSILNLAQTIYLDINPEVSLSRINKRNEEKDGFETLENLTKVHDLYKKYIDKKNTIIVDANQCKDSVWLQIQSKL